MPKFNAVGSRAKHAARMSELVGGFDPGRETQIGFCRKHGLSLSTFLYWRRRVESPPPGLSSFVEVTVDPGAREEQGFEVLVGGMISARFPAGTGEETLRRFLAAARGIC